MPSDNSNQEEFKRVESPATMPRGATIQTTSTSIITIMKRQMATTCMTTATTTRM